MVLRGDTHTKYVAPLYYDIYSVFIWSKTVKYQGDIICVNSSFFVCAHNWKIY